jgi:hypothetical protein
MSISCNPGPRDSIHVLPKGSAPYLSAGKPVLAPPPVPHTIPRRTHGNPCQSPAATRNLMILPRKAHLLYLVFIIPANTKYSINRPFIQMIERPPPENFDALKPRPECLRIRTGKRNTARKTARKPTLPGHATNATWLLLERLADARQARIFLSQRTQYIVGSGCG